MQRFWIMLVLVVCLTACGTHNVKLEPVTVEPIHLTVDVNLHDTAADGAQTKAP